MQSSCVNARFAFGFSADTAPKRSWRGNIHTPSPWAEDERRQIRAAECGRDGLEGKEPGQYYCV